MAIKFANESTSIHANTPKTIEGKSVDMRLTKNLAAVFTSNFKLQNANHVA